MLTITPNFAQERGLNMLRRNWKQYSSFMVYSPTGSGKTGLSAFIVDGFVSRGLRILFVAPYTVLLDQTAQRFVEYGLPVDEISYIWRNHSTYDPLRMIQIASADTLIRREFPNNIDLLIIDEAHLRRKKLLEVMLHLANNTEVKIIGLSGTPFSPFLGNYYQCLVKPTTIKELIQRGDLSGYEFYAPTTPNLKGVTTTHSQEYGKDYNETQLAKIMCDFALVGDIVSNWLENGRDLPTICFCVNVMHANYITLQFNQSGINAEVMTADTPHDERQLIIHRFETGSTKIIVNVGVLVAGFDSDVRCIIYARPTKSEIRWLQCIGRGLRTATGKANCLIFDHSGSVHRLGYPDCIEYDELPSKSDGMNESTMRSAEERQEKLPKECTQCHFMKPAGVYVCPKCGFKPLAGEDVATDKSRKLNKLNGIDKVYTTADKQAWWSQIKFYQRQRISLGKSVSDGWCSHTYRAKFGEWPAKSLSPYPMELTPEVSNFIKHKQIAYAKSAKRPQPDPLFGLATEPMNPPSSNGTQAMIKAKETIEKRRIELTEGKRR